MPELIDGATRILAAGTKPKVIDEYVGRARAGEGRLRYSTTEPDGAEYIAVCLPAFSPETVHRDA